MLHWRIIALVKYFYKGADWMMKYLKYVVIVSLSLAGLGNSTTIFAEDVIASAEKQNSIFVDAILNKDVYTLDQLHQTFGEPSSDEVIDDTISRQTFIMEKPEEAISLEVIADVTTDVDEVISLTFNIDFQDIVYEDADTFKDTYSGLVDTALDMHNNEIVVQKNQIIESLGKPTTITLAGSYELLIYSAGDDMFSKDFIVVLLDDKVYALNEHTNEDFNFNKDFNISQAQLNQMAHTSGVTYNDMIQEIGEPDSVFHDFPNSIITYVWYSDTDEAFSEISYITDFRDIMVGIGHQLQGE